MILLYLLYSTWFYDWQQIKSSQLSRLVSTEPNNLHYTLEPQNALRTGSVCQNHVCKLFITRLFFAHSVYCTVAGRRTPHSGHDAGRVAHTPDVRAPRTGRRRRYRHFHRHADALCIMQIRSSAFIKRQHWMWSCAGSGAQWTGTDRASLLRERFILVTRTCCALCIQFIQQHHFHVCLSLLSNFAPLFRIQLYFSEVHRVTIMIIISIAWICLLLMNRYWSDDQT